MNSKLFGSSPTFIGYASKFFASIACKPGTAAEAETIRAGIVLDRAFAVDGECNSGMREYYGSSLRPLIRDIVGIEPASRPILLEAGKSSN